MTNRRRARILDAAFMSGLACVTIGVSCCWSWPIGLVVLGGIMIVTSIIAAMVG